MAKTHVKPNAVEAGTKHHTVDRVSESEQVISIGARPIEKPGHRWLVFLYPTNYRLRRGDGHTWNDAHAFWVPKHTTRKPTSLKMIRNPQLLD